MHFRIPRLADSHVIPAKPVPAKAGSGIQAVDPRLRGGDALGEAGESAKVRRYRGGAAQKPFAAEETEGGRRGMGARAQRVASCARRRGLTIEPSAV